MIIRAAIESDAEAISVITAEIQALHHTAHPALFKPPSLEVFPPDAVCARMRSETAFVLVVEHDDQIVGNLIANFEEHPETSFRYAYRVLQIDQLGVRASHRRMGIGRALMRAAEAEARARNMDMRLLSTWNFNANAIAFFEGEGYAALNQRMRKPLRNV